MEWKAEMMIHKALGKLHKRESSKERTGFRGMRYMVCMAAGVWAGSFTLYVKAEPAILTSPDAAVYEQADEDSGPVGNLVEGSVFEYLGDVTAQDGSVWHQIQTAGGTAGYIRGDKEIEKGQEGEALEEQDRRQSSAVDEKESVPEENGTEESGQEEGIEGTGQPTAKAPAEDGEGNEDRETTGNGETADEAEGEEADEAEDGINKDYEPISNEPVQNNRSKKYSLNAAAKIKERENGREIDTGAESAKRKNTGVDLTLIIGMAVIFFCSGTMYLCVSRIKTLKGKAGAQEAPDEGRSRTLKRAERKKSSSHKRKTKKTGKWMWKKQSVRDKQR